MTNTDTTTSEIHNLDLEDCRTLVDLLRLRASRQGEFRAYRFLENGEKEGESLSFGELDRRARRVAVELTQRGVVGKPVLLLYPPGMDFLVGFFGCLYAGALAVTTPSEGGKRLGHRIAAIAQDSGSPLVASVSTGSSRILRRVEEISTTSDIQLLFTDELSGGLEDLWEPPAIDSDTTAYLQYTSGSISTPKGVVMSHRNVFHNLQLLDRGWNHGPDSVMVSWLPTFHDMGLIYGTLQPLSGGFPCYQMAPAAFIMKPRRWLEAMTRFRGTHSAAPNFAFDLCVSRVPPEVRETLDLSPWRVAVNGSEPVRRVTLERFLEAFEPCGFKASTMSPGYGLAEASLKVTASRWDSDPIVVEVDEAKLRQHRVQRKPAGQPLVGCGKVEPDLPVIIVDPKQRIRCDPGEIGEVWVRGASVAGGYWRRPEETRESFHGFLAENDEGPFLRTGDLGFVEEGELFITGRLKSLLILGGRNHYPQDLELTAEATDPAIRSGCSAAFSVDSADEERLVIAAEVDRQVQKEVEKLGALARAIRRAVAEEHQVAVYDVALLKRGALPKTSSGKIQRNATRDALEQGHLEPLFKLRSEARRQT